MYYYILSPSLTKEKLEGRIRVIGVEKHSRRSKMGTLQGKGLRFRREGSDWRVERKREPGESCGRTVLG